MSLQGNIELPEYNNTGWIEIDDLVWRNSFFFSLFGKMQLVT